MTRRPRTPLHRPDPLPSAIGAHGARFPGHGLPFLRPAGSPEGRWAAMRLLSRAVATGRPPGDRAIARALGCRTPPEASVH